MKINLMKFNTEMSHRLKTFERKCLSHLQKNVDLRQIHRWSISLALQGQYAESSQVLKDVLPPARCPGDVSVLTHSLAAWRSAAARLHADLHLMQAEGWNLVTAPHDEQSEATTQSRWHFNSLLEAEEVQGREEERWGVLGGAGRRSGEEVNRGEKRWIR